MLIERRAWALGETTKSLATKSKHHQQQITIYIFLCKIMTTVRTQTHHTVHSFSVTQYRDTYMTKAGRTNVFSQRSRQRLALEQLRQFVCCGFFVGWSGWVNRLGRAISSSNWMSIKQWLSSKYRHFCWSHYVESLFI